MKYVKSNVEEALYKKCREVLNTNTNFKEPLEIYPEPMEAPKVVIGEKIRLFDSNDKVKLYY